MNKLPYTGKQILEAARAAGKLTVEQVKKLEQGLLKATYKELYHRAQIANQGSETGVALFNEVVMPEFGLTNLDQGCKTKEDYVIIGIKGRLASITNDGDGVLQVADLKAMSYENLVLAIGGNTVVAPSLILNSQFKLNIDDVEETEFSARNFFVAGNSKEYISASTDDAIMMPDGLKIVQRGATLKPVLYLPKGLLLSNPAAGAGSTQYAWETTYIGFKIH